MAPSLDVLDGIPFVLARQKLFTRELLVFEVMCACRDNRMKTKGGTTCKNVPARAC